MTSRRFEFLAQQPEHARHPGSIWQAGGLLEFHERLPFLAGIQRLQTVDQRALIRKRERPPEEA